MSLLEKLQALQINLSEQFSDLAEQPVPNRAPGKIKFISPELKAGYKNLFGKECPEDFVTPEESKYPEQMKTAVWNLVCLTKKAVSEIDAAYFKTTATLLAAGFNGLQIKNALNFLDEKTWVPFIVDPITQKIGFLLHDFLTKLSEEDFKPYEHGKITANSMFNHLIKMRQTLKLRLDRYLQLERAWNIDRYKANKKLAERYMSSYERLDLYKEDLEQFKINLEIALGEQNDERILHLINWSSAVIKSTEKELNREISQIEDDFNTENTTLPETQTKLTCVDAYLYEDQDEEYIQYYQKQRDFYNQKMEDFINTAYTDAKVNEEIKKQFQKELECPLLEGILSLLTTPELPINAVIEEALLTRQPDGLICEESCKKRVDLYNKTARETLRDYETFLQALNEVNNSQEEYLSCRKQIKALYSIYSQKINAIKLDEIQTTAQKSDLLESLEKDIRIVESIQTILAPKEKNPLFAALYPFKIKTDVLKKRLEKNKNIILGKITAESVKEKVSNDLEKKKTAEKINKTAREHLASVINQQFKQIQELEAKLLRSEIRKEEVKSHFTEIRFNEIKETFSRPETNSLLHVLIEKQIKNEIELLSALKTNDRQLGEIIRPDDLAALIGHKKEISKYIQTFNQATSFLGRVYGSAMPDQTPLYKMIDAAIQERREALDPSSSLSLNAEIDSTRTAYAKNQVEMLFLNVEKKLIACPINEKRPRALENILNMLAREFEKLGREFVNLPIDWDHFKKRVDLTKNILRMMSNHLELLENPDHISNKIQTLKRMNVETNVLEEEIKMAIATLKPFAEKINTTRKSLSALQEGQETLENNTNLNYLEFPKLILNLQNEFNFLDKTLPELERSFLNIRALEDDKKPITALQDQKNQLKSNIHQQLLSAYDFHKNSIIEKQAKLKTILISDQFADKVSLVTQYQEEFDFLSFLANHLGKNSSDFIEIVEFNKHLKEDLRNTLRITIDELRDIGALWYMETPFGNDSSKSESLFLLEKGENAKKILKLAEKCALNVTDEYEAIKQYRMELNTLLFFKDEAAGSNFTFFKKKPLHVNAKLEDEINEIQKIISAENERDMQEDFIHMLLAFLCQIFNWKTKSQRRMAFSNDLKTAYTRYIRDQEETDLFNTIDEGINTFPDEPLKGKLKSLKNSLETLPDQQISALSSN